MLGSLLVASIAYSPVAAYTPAALSVKKAPLQTNTSYTVKPGQKFKAQEHKDSHVSKPSVTMTNNLVLVNKTHSLPAGYAPKNLVAPKVASVNKSKTMMAPEAAIALEEFLGKI
ncbi:MAG: hypothetical protein ACYCYE_04095 [Clostridia bacterium]